MLSRFDDYPLHQVPRPLAVPATTDRNAYGRYWLGGYHRGGELIVEGAFGRYPNLGVVDGSLSFAIDGVQEAFHASGAAPADPTDTSVGPMRLEIIEPMRRLRVLIEPNETGISADLHWTSRVGALLEDHTVMEDGGRVIVDMERFVQFGAWEGSITVDGTGIELEPGQVVGVRDRSWGVRPVGAAPAGRPSAGVPSAWLWAPLHFDDECRSLGYFQRPGGEIWRGDGFRIPVVDPPREVTAHDDDGVQRLHPLGQHLEFAPGTRRITAARFDVGRADGAEEVIELAPMAPFLMKGLGYSNPEWGHGHWKGALALGRETWRLDDVDPADPSAQHLHHAVRARIAGREGVGLLEQIIFGPHTQFGFASMLDGAP